MAPEFGKPIHQLPLIPADVLKKHRVHEPLDTRFRSAARLLQALWREDRGLPIGSYVNEAGKRRKLGSRISESAGRGGGNFLTPEIAHTARREAAYREIGAFFDAEFRMAGSTSRRRKAEIDALKAAVSENCTEIERARRLPLPESLKVSYHGP
jgi:hypothetical protein